MKSDLHRYLQEAREALLWKLDGLSPYDARRPMTRTGTNVLGVVKHVAGVEAGYLGMVFDRPFPEPLPGYGEGAEPNDDMWATAEESIDDVVGFYRRVWAHSDATIEALDLDAVGSVFWWPEERRQVTLHRIVVHLIAETYRHAGQVDIVRELLDGEVGMVPGRDNMPSVDDAGWEAYRARLEAVARDAVR